jgi:outer membrane putative beta-barrel porin/alpha-amylase
VTSAKKRIVAFFADRHTERKFHPEFSRLSTRKVHGECIGCMPADYMELGRSTGCCARPHARDDEIARLFIAAGKDNEDFVRQITEWVFNAS